MFLGLLLLTGASGLNLRPRSRAKLTVPKMPGLARRTAAPLLLGSAALLAPHTALAAPLAIPTALQGGFAQAFSLIFVSELGDKTFFIAGLLAVKYGRVRLSP